MTEISTYLPAFTGALLIIAGEILLCLNWEKSNQDYPRLISRGLGILTIACGIFVFNLGLVQSIWALGIVAAFLAGLGSLMIVWELLARALNFVHCYLEYRSLRR